jgi:hypothetical protein
VREDVCRLVVIGSCSQMLPPINGVARVDNVGRWAKRDDRCAAGSSSCEVLCPAGPSLPIFQQHVRAAAHLPLSLPFLSYAAKPASAPAPLDSISGHLFASIYVGQIRPAAANHSSASGPGLSCRVLGPNDVQACHGHRPTHCGIICYPPGPNRTPCCGLVYQPRGVHERTVSANSLPVLSRALKMEWLMP